MYDPRNQDGEEHRYVSHHNRSAGLALIIASIAVSGCFRHETIEECGDKSSYSAIRDCIDQHNERDIAMGAASGAVGGGILGAAAGQLIAGKAGLLPGLASGIVVGGAAGGVITYYIVNKNADALADILASNQNLQAQVEAYRNVNRSLEVRTSELSHALSVSKQEIEVEKTKNVKEVMRLQELIRSLKASQSDFQKAVVAKYNGTPDEIALELKERDQQIASLEQLAQDANLRVNSLEEMLRRRIKMDLSPNDQPPAS